MTDRAIEFRTQGYCVARQLLPAGDLLKLASLIDSQLLPFAERLPRQNGRHERNQVSSEGGLLNPILNLHRCEDQRLQACVRQMADMVCSPELADVLRQLTGQQHHHVMQSLYFDQSANAAHQDGIYARTVPMGQIITAWIVLETPSSRTNQLYVVPGETPIDLSLSRQQIEFGDYHQQLADKINALPDGPTFPDLALGDVVFLNSTIIHGTTTGTSGRLRRIAPHYAPAGAMYRGYYSEEFSPVESAGLRVGSSPRTESASPMQRATASCQAAASISKAEWIRPRPGPGWLRHFRCRRWLHKSRRRLLESGLFDAEWYQQIYPDVSSAGITAVDHYLLHGADEGRQPGPDFPLTPYFFAHPECSIDRANPVLHFLATSTQRPSNDPD